MLCPLLYSHTLLISFFFNDTATTEIYTLSLHDALPIFVISAQFRAQRRWDSKLHALEMANRQRREFRVSNELIVDPDRRRLDRKSTRLNSSHSQISYAVFCLKKKKKKKKKITNQKKKQK